LAADVADFVSGGEGTAELEGRRGEFEGPLAEIEGFLLVHTF